MVKSTLYYCKLKLHYFMKIDTGKNGLEVFFKPWQVAALQVVREALNGATSATVWRQVLAQVQ